MSRFLFFLLTFLSSMPLWAQELNSTVSVNYTQVQGVDPKVFQSLQQGLITFLNTHKWTDDNFENSEKITCNFLLTITQKSKSDNIFTAYLTIQAFRPVYNTDYNSPIINYQDKDVIFRYDQSQTIQFDLNNVAGSDPMTANLTDIFAYYVYYILGLDYDSFSPNGGTTYFQDAQDIVNRAPDDKSISGWKSTENTDNRYWLVEEVLDPKFSGFRNFWYQYHRMGLDLMTKQPDVAMKNIFSGINVLKKIHDENTNPILLQFYFDAKSLEWTHLIGQAPESERKKLAQQLMNIDPTNSDRYRGDK